MKNNKKQPSGRNSEKHLFPKETEEAKRIHPGIAGGTEWSIEEAAGYNPANVRDTERLGIDLTDVGEPEVDVTTSSGRLGGSVTDDTGGITPGGMDADLTSGSAGAGVFGNETGGDFEFGGKGSGGNPPGPTAKGGPMKEPAEDTEISEKVKNFNTWIENMP